MGALLRLLATANIEKLLRNSFSAVVAVLLLFMLYHFADRMLTSQEKFSERLVNNGTAISQTQEQQSAILDRIDHTTQQTSQTVADIKDRLSKPQ